MLMERDDLDLVTDMLAGDADAFEQLLSRHYDLIFRLAYRLLGAKDAAEDLTQDICASLPTRLTSFRREAKFTTWLYRVVNNAAIDQLRRKKSQTKAADGWGDVERDRQAIAAEQTANRIWLDQAMNSLNDEHRQTLALTLGEGLSHAEAAEVLGVSEGTISWRMSEIKKALKRLHEEEERLT